MLPGKWLMLIRRFFKYWLPVVIYMILIFTISSIKTPPAPEMFPHSDKVGHAVEYAILGFIMLRALCSSKERLSGFNLRLLAFSLAALYGIIDEVHQYFIPGRNMEILDMLSDGIGAYIGQLLFKMKG